MANGRPASYVREARAISWRTGVDVPSREPADVILTRPVAEQKAGFAGRFGSRYRCRRWCLAGLFAQHLAARSCHETGGGCCLGLGTSGTQTLIYGFVANYYRTNVRGTGVAWCAGFGRLGGVGSPLLGGFLIGGGFALNSIFCVLAGLTVLGVVLTLVVPMARRQRESLHRPDAVRAGPLSKLPASRPRR